MEQRRNAYVCRYLKKSAQVVSFTVFIPVAETVSFPTLELPKRHAY
ncbi:MAG: hypothetical protein PHF70_05550 [Opitutales bacterium]|nr:hypothetical protein [Opitutales bacterium]